MLSNTFIGSELYGSVTESYMLNTDALVCFYLDLKDSYKQDLDNSINEYGVICLVRTNWYGFMLKVIIFDLDQVSAPGLPVCG